MHKFEYPFFSQNLLVAIPDKLSEKEQLELDDLLARKVATLFRDLSSRMPGSYTYRLNSSDLGYPVRLPAVVWNFIQTNIDYYQTTDGEISPFEDEVGRKTALPVQDFWELDPDNLTITRKADVKFNSNQLLTSHSLDQIAALLSQSGLKEFLINAFNVSVARGRSDWAIEFLHPEDNSQLEIVGNNVAAAMNLPLQLQQAAPEPSGILRNPFAHIVTAPGWKAVIAEGESAVRARVAARMAAQINYDYQFNDFVKNWRCGLTIFKPGGEVAQFSY